MSKSSRGAARAVIAALGAAACLVWAPAQASVTIGEKNVVSALYSYDAILGFTGLRFGVDPTHPQFAMAGTFSDSGFSWSTSTTYLGQAFTYTASGTFDPATATTIWSGSGSLGAKSLSSSGTTAWADETHFAIKDSTSVNGVPTLWSIDAAGNPAANEGTTLVVHEHYTVIQELATRHWYSFLFGPVTDGWFIKDVNDGVIQSNVYTLKEEGTTLGVTVGLGTLGGTVNFGGNTYQKVGFVSGAPEPAAWECLLAGFGLLGLALRRRRAMLSAI